MFFNLFLFFAKKTYFNNVIGLPFSKYKQSSENNTGKKHTKIFS